MRRYNDPSENHSNPTPTPEKKKSLEEGEEGRGRRGPADLGILQREGGAASPRSITTLYGSKGKGKYNEGRKRTACTPLAGVEGGGMCRFIPTCMTTRKKAEAREKGKGATCLWYLKLIQKKKEKGKMNQQHFSLCITYRLKEEKDSRPGKKGGREYINHLMFENIGESKGEEKCRASRCYP